MKIHIRVTDAGRTIFATPVSTYRAERALPPVRLTVEEGMLRGMVVETSIDSRVATLLVFGGMPRLLPVYSVIATTLARDATAEVDRDAVRQIVLDLLDNAVKDGPVWAGAARTVERGVRITIDDSGPGIPARERKRI